MITIKDKEAFFKNVGMPFINHIENHFKSNTRTLRFNLNKSIFDNIINELLFHYDNVDGIMMSRTLSLFKKNEPTLKTSIDKFDVTPCNKYVIEINTSKKFAMKVASTFN